MILLKWFTNIGRERTAVATSGAEAIEKMRNARRNNGGNFRKWSFDGGKTWITY
jgi:hypothetical protein